MQSAIPRQSEQRSGMGSVAILAVCQALGMSCMALSITITALVGKGLAPTPALATLPLALQFVAAAAMTLPPSLLMGRFRPRAGLPLGLLLGIARLAVFFPSGFLPYFSLFCLGAPFLLSLGPHLPL